LLAGLFGGIFGFGMQRRTARETSPFAGWD